MVIDNGFEHESKIMSKNLDYIDTNKDPWKQFVLELKEMIEKEEQ